ncbi:MAG: hypothetical protein P1U77_26355 [Rubripirellula sp.]|nr:hypothetical protein [Rubripirellula sp.]
MDWILHNDPILIPLAPLAAAVYSAVPIGSAGGRKYGFGVFAHIVAFVVAVVALGEVVSTDARYLVICATPWSFLPTIELPIDRLSAVMMLVITSIGLVLYCDSIRYLQSEREQPRCQALLALAIATLLVMGLSRDLILLFLAWQLLSWLLCPLVYNHANLLATGSSFRTFIMLRAGTLRFSRASSSRINSMKRLNSRSSSTFRRNRSRCVRWVLSRSAVLRFTIRPEFMIL